jgi:hypothetical protein
LAQNDEDHVNISNNIEHNNVDADGGHDNDNDNDEGCDAPGPTVLASVELAKTMLWISDISQYIF